MVNAALIVNWLDRSPEGAVAKRRGIGGAPRDRAGELLLMMSARSLLRERPPKEDASNGMSCQKCLQ